MSMHSQCEELREAVVRFEGYQNGEISRMLREAAYTIESLRDRLQNLAFERGMNDALEALRRGECEESIVRCRDCVYYVEDYDPIDPGWPMMCERTDDDMIPPYCFCAWGQRKEGDDD